MHGRLWVLAMASVTWMVSSGSIAADLPEKMSALLMPPSQLDSAATLAVDWDIDDLSQPDTPFEKAVVPRLLPLGVTGSISATYELPDAPAALISFEAHRYNSTVNIIAALDSLKPGLLEKAERKITNINGLETLIVSHSSNGPIVYVIADDRLLFVVGAPNPSATDVPKFLKLYFSWRETDYE